MAKCYIIFLHRPLSRSDRSLFLAFPICRCDNCSITISFLWSFATRGMCFALQPNKSSESFKKNKKARNAYICGVCIHLCNLVPRVSRARRDPGRVWSCAFVTIENTREGSSLNKEFVDVLHSIYFKS